MVACVFMEQLDMAFLMPDFSRAEILFLALPMLLILLYLPLAPELKSYYSNQLEYLLKYFFLLSTNLKITNNSNALPLLQREGMGLMLGD